MKYILLLLFIPSTILAHGSATLRDHANQRALIRIGRTIRQRAVSPRRVQDSIRGTVTNVIDGSVMIVLLDSGKTVTVRTLGAEAPLLTTGTDKEQCFALQAKVQLENLVLHKSVELEKDRNYNADNYGRWLRYIRLNSLDINRWMIDNGNSFADSRNGHRRQASYHASQAEAMDYERGLWGHICEYNENLDTIEILN